MVIFIFTKDAVNFNESDPLNYAAQMSKGLNFIAGLRASAPAYKNLNAHYKVLSKSITD